MVLTSTLQLRMYPASDGVALLVGGDLGVVVG